MNGLNDIRSFWITAAFSDPSYILYRMDCETLARQDCAESKEVTYLDLIPGDGLDTTWFSLVRSCFGDRDRESAFHLF